MKGQLKILAILMALVFGLSGLAFAQDSIGLSVSCTIPAIPGVNAPLNEASTNTAPEPEEMKTETSSPDPEPQEEQPLFIEEVEEIQLAQQAEPVLIKIIYSR